MAHDHHHHDHGHHGHAATPSHAPALGRAGAINLAWALAQAVAGASLGSAALLSDSVHNLGDAAGLVMAWGAATLALRSATSRRTWGWHRGEQLAGFANALLVVVGALVVAAGASWRLLHPAPLDGLAVSAWALGGIAVNALSAWWLSGHGGDLNTRGAFLHLVSDAAISATVVAGGLAVHFTDWSLLDPLLALVVSVWLVKSTLPFLRETFDALLDAVPAGRDLPAIEAELAAVPGVGAVHDLHLWSLGGGRAALSAHLVHHDGQDPTTILEQALDRLHHHHPGLHATLQVEPPGVETWHGHEVCRGRE